MKTRLLTSILILFLTGISTTFAQGFQAPSEGKAVVYFVRVTGYGGGVSFEYFHQDKYIGFFKGVNYLRYECDPGENLFWASSENKEFITADLKAGGTYIVIVDVIMGMMKAHVGLKPLPTDDKELFQRVKEVIGSRPATVTPQKKIDDTNKKLGEKFIPEQLKNYNEEWKATRNYKHISADMAINPEDLK